MSNNYDNAHEAWNDFYKGITEGKEFGEALNNGEVGNYLLDKTGNWVTDNPDILFNAVFGEDLVKKSRIDVKDITNAKNIGNSIKDGIEVVYDTAEFVDTINKLNTAKKNFDNEAYNAELSNLGNCILNGAKHIASDPINSAIIGCAQNTYNKGVNEINNHVSQLKYTEVMCDYYSGKTDAKGAAEALKKVTGLSKTEKAEIAALLEMQEQLEKNGVKADKSNLLKDLINKGNEIHNNMSEKEKDKYGKEWPYDTTDETKENASDGADEAGSKQPPRDPLVIDLGRKGIELTNVDNGVHFDLDKNGFAEKTAWIGTEDGFLALDRNGNGIIDDGGELFGDQVDINGKLASSGFEALKQLDDNVNSETGEIGDGVIDENDSRFHDLRVWIDANHNGKTDSGELKTLDELGITSISLNHTDKNVVDSQSGTIITESSVVNFKDGSTSEISEHWFEVKTYDTEERDETGETLKVESVEAFGNVRNLNSAIKEDETGELGNLVERFKNSTDYIEKRILLKKILYFITDAADINPNSRGGNMDARDLCVIEAFLGRKFVGVDGGSSPNVNAAPILKNVYADIERMYFNLLNKETVVGDYLNLVLKRWNENGLYLDVSAFNSKVSEMIENGENVENVLSGVASWLKQYDNAFGESYSVELSKEFTDYSELLNRVSSAGVLLGGVGNDTLNERY